MSKLNKRLILHDEAWALIKDKQKTENERAIEASNREKAIGLHNLICNMLRANVPASFPANEMLSYMHKVGIAIHNIPFNLISGEELTKEQLNEINALDPSAKDGAWGDWVQDLLLHFHQSI